MLNILAGIFLACCALILPLTITVVLCVRHKGIWKPILLGALTFSFFQMLTRIPLLQFVLGEQAWFIAFSSAQPFLYALFLGTTAALFEEGGRFIVMSLFLKKQRTNLDGFAFGIGHGGIEAILFAGINALMMVLSESFPSAPNLIFAGGIERLSAMMMHVAFSIMVIKCLRERNGWGVLLAFAIHTLVDFISVYAAAALGVWPLEIVLLIIAAAMGLFVYRTFEKSDDTPQSIKGV